MNTTVLLTVVMPAVLAFVMFGIGLSLKLNDFRRVAHEPKAVGIGLICQICVLPLVAYGLVRTLDLAPPYAIGFMILAASPGGSTANLLSHLAGGAVALNVTLTAVSSVLSIVTVPLIAQWSLNHFLGQGQPVELESSKLIQTILIVIIPMAAGMWLAAIRPKISARMQQPVQLTAIVLILLLVIGSILKEQTKLVAAAQIVGGAVIAFNLISMGLGYTLPRIFKMNEREAVAVAFEVGIHNGSLAMALSANPVIVDAVRAAGHSITDFSVAFPAAAYSVFMYLTAGLLVWISRRRFRSS